MLEVWEFRKKVPNVLKRVEVPENPFGVIRFDDVERAGK